MTESKDRNEDAIRRGVSGNAMSNTGPAQPDQIDRPDSEAVEAEEANLEMEQAFEDDDTAPVPPGTDKVGTVRGSPD